MHREQIRQILIGLTSRGWVLMLAWAILATALLLTDSQWAVLSTFVGLTTLLVVMAANHGRRIRPAITLIICVFVSGVAFVAFSGETVVGRFASVELENENRMAAYQLTVSATTDTPWLGVGYGAFEEVFRIYRDESIPEIYATTHNIFLENALELGIPAFASFLMAVTIAVSYCTAGTRRRRRANRPWFR